MSTGIFSNQLSFVRRHGPKALGLAVLGVGLVLGGCNGKLKDENEALRTENADLKERITSTESEKSTIQTQLTQCQNEKATFVTAQRPNDYYPPSGPRERTPKQAAANKTFEISGDVLFTPGSVTLKPEAKSELNKLLPQIKAASSVEIVGHTDSDPIKKSKYGTNQALSKARADSVRDYLVSKGVPRNAISTVGKGASEPKATKKESRRVDIVLAE